MSEWEKEFDEKITHFCYAGGKHYGKPVKQFIRKTRQQAKKEMGKALRMEKKKVRRGIIFELQTEDGYMGKIDIVKTEDEIYNQAVSEQNKKIDDYLKEE